MWPFRKKLKLNPAELAELLDEITVDEPDGKTRQESLDWQLDVIEKAENEGCGHERQFFQAIRAELYRRGIRHSKRGDDGPNESA